MSTICWLKACSGGTQMSRYCGEKLQGEVYQKVNQVIPPTVNFTPGSCGELGASRPRESLGLFIQSVPLHQERLSSCIVLLF